MRSNRGLWIFIGLSLISSACGSSSNDEGSCTTTSFSGTTYATVGTETNGGNVVPVTVNGNLCGSTQYPNEICTSVTICSPTQPTNCQTINNILVDTGSYGLRIFSSLITVPLVPITSGGMNLAECVQFGDGSSEWGQVEYAYVQLGNEPAVGVPIHVINSSYATPPALCSTSQSTPDIGPEQTGFNGILGVGLFAQDCGASCVQAANNEMYYTCNGSDCSCGATATLNAQVQSPVAALPTDNNGVILKLPSVSSSGVASVSGSLVLGIGTQSNNTPSSVTTYFADQTGSFTTTFTGVYSSQPMTSSFIDSGSNILFFPVPAGASLPDCSVSHGSTWQGLYCPFSLQSFQANNLGGTGGGTVSFQVENAFSLINSGLMVFNNLAGNGGNSSISYFDWGLPFFFGRNVYVGIDGTTSSLGTGPYWAY